MIHFSSSIWRRLFQPLPFVLCSWILTKWALSFPYPRAAFPWVHGRVPRNFCPAVLSVGSAQPCVYLSNYCIIDALIINTQRHYWVYIPNEQWYYHWLIITFLKTLLCEESSTEQEAPRLWNVGLELHSSSRLSFSPSKQFKYFLSAALHYLTLFWCQPDLVQGGPAHGGVGMRWSFPIQTILGLTGGSGREFLPLSVGWAGGADNQLADAESCSLEKFAEVIPKKR